MQLKSLRLFMAVVETGSFVAAAQQGHTVQSNVTTHIKKLEEELGVRLFERAGRVRPTSAGMALIDYAERMLTTHDEALALFQGHDNTAGRLRIGAMETTTALRLPPILAAYHAAEPNVAIELTTGPTAELVQRLLDGQLDCTFVAGPVGHDRCHQLEAFREELVLVSATPMATMPSRESLLGATFLAFRQGCSYRQRIELLLASQGITAGRIFEFGSLDAMLACVAAGMGYALLPLATVDAHRERFDIHSLTLPPSIAHLTTYFVAPEQATWTPALASFASLVSGTAEVTPPRTRSDRRLS